MSVRRVDDTSHVPVLDASTLDALAELAPGDPAFIDQLIETFVGRTSELLDELVEASSREDWNTVTRIAHGFCSSCAQIGAMRASHLARQVVTISRASDDVRTSEIEEPCKELVTALQAALVAFERWRRGEASAR